MHGTNKKKTPNLVDGVALGQLGVADKRLGRDEAEERVVGRARQERGQGRLARVGRACGRDGALAVSVRPMGYTQIQVGTHLPCSRIVAVGAALLFSTCWMNSSPLLMISCVGEKKTHVWRDLHA